MIGISREREHDAHWNEEEKGYTSCHQVIAHCESREEQIEVFEMLQEEFDLPVEEVSDDD